MTSAHTTLLAQILESQLTPAQLQTLAHAQGEQELSAEDGQDQDTIDTPEWDAADEERPPRLRLRGRLRRERPLPQGNGTPILSHGRDSTAEMDADEARAKKEAQKSDLPHVRKGMHHCSTCGTGYYTSAKAIACHGSGEYRARGRRQLSHSPGAGRHDLEDPAAHAALSAGLSEGTRLAARVRKQVLAALKKK